LIIDADAVLAPAVSGQSFKSVAWQSGKISERRGGLKTVKLQASRAFDPGKGLDPISGGEVPAPLVAIADNHQFSIGLVMRYVQRISRFRFRLNNASDMREAIPSLLLFAWSVRRSTFFSYWRKTFFQGAALRSAWACDSKAGKSCRSLRLKVDTLTLLPYAETSSAIDCFVLLYKNLLTAGASKRILEHVQLKETMDEVVILRVIAVAFLAGVPVALFYIVRPAPTAARRRIRWTAAGFLGIGTCYLGWGASWPGPNSVTLFMMGGGLLTFLVSTVCFASSLFFSRKKGSRKKGEKE
jgi:hypothetical protein